MRRLENIFADLGDQPGGHTCQAMQGLVAEGSDMIEGKAVPAVKDAGLIAAAQRVEHYEIAGYGTVRTYANLLGYTDHAAMLEASEQEEKAADLKLTQLSREINLEAALALSRSRKAASPLTFRHIASQGTRRGGGCPVT